MPDFIHLHWWTDKSGFIGGLGMCLTTIYVAPQQQVAASECYSMINMAY